MSPSVVFTGSRAISPCARPLTLRPRFTPGLPFSAVDIHVAFRLGGVALEPHHHFSTCVRRTTRNWSESLRLVCALTDSGRAMSLQPTLEEQEQLADTLRR